MISTITQSMKDYESYQRQQACASDKRSDSVHE